MEERRKWKSAKMRIEEKENEIQIPLQKRLEADLAINRYITTSQLLNQFSWNLEYMYI